MSDERKGEDLAMVRKHVSELAEHFDSVHIFATKHDGGADSTVNINVGAGNWFTRYGQVRHWIVKESEQTRIDVRNSQDED